MPRMPAFRSVLHPRSIRSLPKPISLSTRYGLSCLRFCKAFGKKYGTHRDRVRPVIFFMWKQRMGKQQEKRALLTLFTVSFLGACGLFCKKPLQKGHILKDSFIITNIKKASRTNQLANFMPHRYFGLRFGVCINKAYYQLDYQQPRHK